MRNRRRAIRTLIAYAALLATLAQAAPAQNLSVADISALVDKAQNGKNDYRALLNDPDPERARLAMQIMLEQGDAALQRIALEHGLFSTDAGVRRVALEGFLRSKPVLTIRADGAAAIKNNRDYLVYYVQQAKGSVDGAGKVLLNYQLGEFNEDDKCFTYSSRDGGDCAFRLTDASLNMLHYGQWTEFRLDPDGSLRGEIFINQVGVIPAEIPVSQ